VDVKHLGIEDEVLIKRLIDQHAKFTGSARAQTILANWALWSRKFVKVMPIEYRRALAEMAAKKAQEQPKKQKAA
jgi:glutamate synthase (NADPH/NADH) large chain